jgi:exodeoxyribonuclease-3
MRLATWNVNGLRSRLLLVLDWLSARGPDIVGFQEIKLGDEQFPHLAFESVGYRAVVHGQKAWNGVAILSREPARVEQVGLPGEEEAGARLLTASVGPIAFTNVYVPNGKSVHHADYPRKLAWLASLHAHVAERHDPSRPHVVCGDFNVCPTALDTWDEAGMRGEIFHTDAERAAIARLADLGLGDAFREVHPGERLFSWWDYRGGAFHRGQGLRIDLLFVTRSLHVRSATIDREYRKKRGGLVPSDHAPVLVEVDIHGGAEIVASAGERLWVGV